MSKRLVLLVERRGRRGARADVRADQTLEDGRLPGVLRQIGLVGKVLLLSLNNDPG